MTKISFLSLTIVALLFLSLNVNVFTNQEVRKVFAVDFLTESYSEVKTPLSYYLFVIYIEDLVTSYMKNLRKMFILTLKISPVVFLRGPFLEHLLLSMKRLHWTKFLCY